MSKNIFLSGIYHETHTFLGEPTTLKDFIIFHDGLLFFIYLIF